MDKKPQRSASTPLMQQYRRIKAQHPDTILLFRVGDFYETFDEDAKKLHQITDIKLTKRSNGAAAAVPLAGFPHHALDNYLTKLVQAQCRVAICDQLEAPQKGKAVVQRAVTELVTPGITYHDTLLDHKKNNYLASLDLNASPHPTGISLLDISTGEFLLTQGDASYIQQLLQRFQPAEIIYNKAQKQHFQTLNLRQYHSYTLEDWIYKKNYAQEQLQQHFQTTNLKGFGIHHLPQAITAAGAILHYLKTTEHKELQHITKITPIQKDHYMWLNKSTIQSLELIQPQQSEGVPLIKVLDHTLTPMGARKLRKWLLFPQQHIPTIQKRHETVALLIQTPPLQQQIKQHLQQIGDLERLASKVATQRINPRELYALQLTLETIPPIIQALSEQHNPTLQALAGRLDPCQNLTQRLQEALKPDPPYLLNQGGYIQSSFSTDLAHYRQLLTRNNAHLQQILETQRQQTQISSLKIGFNKVFGYYLEVTHTHKEKVPPTWIRKQTLTQAERYITPQLKDYEEQILAAQENIQALEQKLYQELLTYAATFIPQIQTTARHLATLDCYQSLAHTAILHQYTRPQLHTQNHLAITQGRHPVIEYTLPPDQTYIPNDLHLHPDKAQILLITGPNMAGKSALLRQTALIVLLAHMGSFVPAQKALIPLTDKIFTRVGASDNLAQQESTFMVEMNETANILHNFTDKSLLIIDELGRGTGTSDGTTLAQSILEHLHESPHRPKTLFATHYHTLNQLTHHYPRIQNYKIDTHEADGKVLFLHKLTKGSTQHSFGIHVAQMAGIPKPIIQRANQLLKALKIDAPQNTPPPPLPPSPPTNPSHAQIIQKLQQIDPTHLTPIDALLTLQALTQLLQD